MILYKYKSLNGHGMSISLDIIINSRLYLADWNQLNDPLEGSFDCISESGNGETLKNAIIHAKKQFKVCSLSKNPKHPLMWSHYADGHKGICIGVEIADSDVCECNYGPFTPLASDRDDPVRFARIALTRKGTDWQYENEYRIIEDELLGDYRNIKVVEVIIGLRIESIHKTILNDICKNKGITIKECATNKSTGIQFRLLPNK